MTDDSSIKQDRSNEQEEPLQTLNKVRGVFLELHRTLLESERIGYEQAFGTIRSPADFLQLAIHDPWFAWLRPLSDFITSLDERAEAEPVLSQEEVVGLWKRGRELLTPQEYG